LADRTAEWALDEVINVKTALDELANRLSELAGRDVHRIMMDLFQGTAFYRDRWYRNNIAYAIGSTVSFYDRWAEYGEASRASYLAHEVGHVLDSCTSPLQLVMGEASDVFAQNVGAYVDDEGAYQLVDLFRCSAHPTGFATDRTARQKTGPNRLPPWSLRNSKPTGAKSVRHGAVKYGELSWYGSNMLAHPDA
jgi:hypothetical protein